jgi:hypothetical protein
VNQIVPVKPLAKRDSVAGGEEGVASSISLSNFDSSSTRSDADPPTYDIRKVGEDKSR